MNRRKIGPYLDRRARRLRWGCHYGHNRSGARDPHLHALSFWTAAGRAAIWWSLAAHTAFFPDMRAVTADFPGALRRHVASTDPACITSFFPGLAGSVIPAVPRYPPRPSLRQSLLSRLPLVPGLGGFTAKTYANWCAALCAAWEGLVPTPLDPQAPVRLANGDIANVFRPGDPPLALRLKRLDLAGTSLLFLSGEPLAEWGPVLTPHLPPGTLVTGYVAGPPAYIAPAACLDQGGYEVRGFQQAFGLQGEISPEINRKMTNALIALQ